MRTEPVEGKNASRVHLSLYGTEAESQLLTAPSPVKSSRSRVKTGKKRNLTQSSKKVPVVYFNEKMKVGKELNPHLL